jgi:hypothetical protein
MAGPKKLRPADPPAAVIATRSLNVNELGGQCRESGEFGCAPLFTTGRKNGRPGSSSKGFFDAQPEEVRFSSLALANAGGNSVVKALESLPASRKSFDRSLSLCISQSLPC